MAHTACLVCFISIVNGRSKKKKPIKTGTSNRHITNLKQSILESFDIYAFHGMRNAEQLNGNKHAAVFRNIINSSTFFCSSKKMSQSIAFNPAFNRIPKWGLLFLYLSYIKR
jgi:hypothetical protein